MDVMAQDLDRGGMASLLVNAVVPRPIAWVSTVDAEGRPNLAPFSFFNVICVEPPLLGFSPGLRAGQTKDTLRNVRATGEFVVNVVPHALAEAMNLSAGEYGPEVDEFALARLATRPSRSVKPPQVAASPVAFECRLHQILDFDTASLVIGRILCVHADDAVMEAGRIVPERLDIVGRLGGADYCTTRDRFALARPRP